MWSSGASSAQQVASSCATDHLSHCSMHHWTGCHLHSTAWPLRTVWCGRATLDMKAALPAALKLPLPDTRHGTSRPSGDRRNLQGTQQHSERSAVSWCKEKRCSCRASFGAMQQACAKEVQHNLLLLHNSNSPRCTAVNTVCGWAWRLRLLLMLPLWVKPLPLWKVLLAVRAPAVGAASSPCCALCFALHAAWAGCCWSRTGNCCFTCSAIQLRRRLHHQQPAWALLIPV